MSDAGLIYKHLSERAGAPAEGSLRVWWIPQIPMEYFYWRVESLAHATTLLDALAAYDDFQFANGIKGDYANMGGLDVFRDGDWEDWYSEDGDDFDTWRRLQEP